MLMFDAAPLNRYPTRKFTAISAMQTGQIVIEKHIFDVMDVAQMGKKIKHSRTGVSRWRTARMPACPWVGLEVGLECSFLFVAA